MPQFNFADEDIKALRIVLGGFRERKVGQRYLADQGLRVQQVVEGRRLMQQYNCVGCHEIEKRGGFVRKYYQENVTSGAAAAQWRGREGSIAVVLQFLESA